MNNKKLFKEKWYEFLKELVDLTLQGYITEDEGNELVYHFNKKYEEWLKDKDLEKFTGIKIQPNFFKDIK